MRVYYHIYPTCPQCHEPHVNGSPLEDYGDCIYCPSCSAYFYKSVDMVSSDRFTKTIETLRNEWGEEIIDYLKKMPLAWRIDLNPVEKEYISWVSKAEKGCYLITWPWRDVRFIPVLASEFLIDKSESRAVVIGNVSEKYSSDELAEFPTIDNVFRSLVYIESPRTKFDDFKTEINRFDRRIIFKKMKVVHYTISDSSGKSHSEGICTETIRKCKNRLLRDLKEDFGENPVRFLKWKKMRDKNWSKQILNENGFIDIVLEEREQYMGNNVRYRSHWLWEILLNSRKIKRPSKIIRHKVLRQKDELGDPDSERLFFISSDIDPQDIFSMIAEINPDLVIFQNADEFMRDLIINGHRSREFINFLHNLPDSIVLMFSTIPEVRYLYGINFPSRFSITQLGVIPHTWDCNAILDRLRKILEKTGQRYHSPASSNIHDLPKTQNLPEIEYIEVEEINRLEKTIAEIGRIFNGDMGRDMLKFLQDMIKSPLHFLNLRRKGKLTGHPLTYEYIISQIQDRFGDEKAREIHNVFQSVYGDDQEHGSPIMKKIVEKMIENLDNEDCKIALVVHSFDVQRTQKILENHYLVESYRDRLLVCSWIDILKILGNKRDKKDLYLMTTLLPPYFFNLDSMRIKKAIFIGGKKFIETVSKVIKNRLDENMQRPLYILSEEESAPCLLKKLQEDLELDSNQAIMDFAEEFMFELEEKEIHDSISQVDYQSYPLILKPGEKALLFVDFNGRGAFIPSNSSLLVASGTKLEEISVGEIMEKGPESILKDKELLLNRQSLYSSFRTDFIKLMMEYGERFVFKKGPYVWNGFDELLKDAVEWALLLRIAVERYSRKMKISHEEAEKEISEYLASLGIVAKNPNYIRKWWNDFEIILTKKGPVYVFSIEHPRSPKDLEKIYRGIAELLPELDIDPRYANKCYAAAIMIQNFRRSLLKGKIKSVSPTLKILYRKIEKEIKKIVDSSEKFRVNLVYTVEITKEVHPYRIMDNFWDFCRQLD